MFAGAEQAARFIAEHYPEGGRIRCCSPWDNTCLLYTSDAADERSSVDLGGRRIIKKKKKIRDTRQ